MQNLPTQFDQADMTNIPCAFQTRRRPARPSYA